MNSLTEILVWYLIFFLFVFAWFWSRFGKFQWWFDTKFELKFSIWPFIDCLMLRAQCWLITELRIKLVTIKTNTHCTVVFSEHQIMRSRVLQIWIHLAFRRSDSWSERTNQQPISEFLLYLCWFLQSRMPTMPLVLLSFGFFSFVLFYDSFLLLLPKSVYVSAIISNLIMSIIPIECKNKIPSVAEKWILHSAQRTIVLGKSIRTN